MQILLIGNFAPPFEEENLHNISLLNKLKSDGHSCTVLNISKNPSFDSTFINTNSIPDFVIKLFTHCRDKDIVHFSTKGYLRVGLLKLMASIFAGKLFRAKTVITFHSEFFSVLGQMRSPFGGTQTLNTTFYLVDKIIYNDQDTYNVASMYRKKPNFELIPSFVHLPDEITSAPDRLANRKRAIVFSNIIKDSFAFEILTELLANHPVSSETAIVISLPENNTSETKHLILEAGKGLTEGIVFIEQNDIQSMLSVFSKAAVMIRPMSCDGETFFKEFSVSIKEIRRLNNDLYFPGGLVLVKEGNTARMCVNIINTMITSEAGEIPELHGEDPYIRITRIYKE